MNVFELPFRYLLTFVIVGLVSVVSLLISYRAEPIEHGWSKVGPGAYHWVSIVLAALMFVFLSTMAVHSGWPKATGQNLIFYALLVGSLAGTIYLTFYVRTIRRANLWWRDSWIAFTDGRAGRSVQNMSDIVDAYERWDQYIVLQFSDGEHLKIDPYCSGAHQLCEAIHEWMRREGMMRHQDSD
jgi:hypothetical protein